MRIFVLGTGYAGSRIAGELTACGHEVVGMNRRKLRDVVWQAEEGDALSPPPRLRQLGAFDAIVGCLSGTGRKDIGEYREIYVEGLRRVVETLTLASNPRVLFLSSTGVYGQHDGELVDESSPTSPVHAQGGVMLEAENMLDELSMDRCALRLSGIYGPGRWRMIQQAMRSRPYLKPDVWANQIHVDDIAGVVRQLFDQLVWPTRLIVSDDQPSLRREVFDWIRTEAGHPDGFVDEEHGRTATRNRGNRRMNNTRLRELGIHLRYPSYREGYSPLLRDAIDSLARKA